MASIVNPRENPERVAILDMVRPDPLEAHTGYTIKNPPSYVDDEGVEVRCVDGYDLLPAPPGQAYEATVIVDEREDLAGNTVRDEVTIGNRPMIILRWRTIITPSGGGPPIVDQDWLSIGTVPHGGNSMQLSKRMIERNPLDVTGAQGNPNMGGAAKYHFFTGTQDPLIKHGGMPLHFLGQTNPSFLFESGQRMIDFGGDPNNYPQSEKGQSQDHPAFWYNIRCWMRVVRERNKDGSPTAFKSVDQWFYDRDDWTNNGLSRPLIVSHDFSCAAVGRVFNEAYFYDIKRGFLFNITGFDPGGLAENLKTYRVTTRKFSIFGVSNSPFNNSGRIGIILRQTSTDFCVAFAVRLSDCNSDLDVYGIEADRPRAILVQQSLFNGVPGIVENNIVSHIGIVCPSDRMARKGWIGWRSWMYTGLFSQVVAEMQGLYISGIIERQPSVDLPETVIDGTEFPPASWHRNGSRRA